MSDPHTPLGALLYERSAVRGILTFGFIVLVFALAVFL